MSSTTLGCGSRTEKARLCNAIKKLQKENAKLARARGRMLQQIASGTKTSSAPHSPKALELFAEVNRRHCDRLQQQYTRHEILSNMVSNNNVPESRRRYTVAVLSFAMIIASISLTSYKTMRNFLYLPSPSYLYRLFKPEIEKLKGMITNFQELEVYLDYLSEKLGESKENITKYGGILAVDAVSLRPHVVVTKDGFVNGVINSEHVDKEMFEELEKSFLEYERFIKKIRNKTITDSFVYYFQPLDSGSRCFTVFLEPSTQGKATGTQIDRLESLALVLEEKGFPVVGFGFDGDSTYARLHKEFFDTYFVNCSQDAQFENFSTVSGRLIISDPLHLLKRARYRLLSSSVHGDFENRTESIIEIDKLQAQLDLPSVVFSNEKYTKMHDSLATQLFSFRTLASLLKNKNYTALTYFLPLCLLCGSLEEESLSVDERFSFLQVGFFYMLSYYSMSLEHGGPLRQKKHRGNTHVCAFDSTFVREYCNTVMSILKVLSDMNGTIALNRLGSNPVEHLFGLLRMKSHSVHTWDKMLQVMAKTTLQQNLLRDIGPDEPIDKRLSYFAVNVINNPSRLKTVLDGEPRDIAFVLDLVFNLPITIRDLMVWDGFSMFDLQIEIFENFRSKVLQASKRCQQRNGRTITSTRIALHAGTQIQSRLSDRTLTK